MWAAPEKTRTPGNPMPTELRLLAAMAALNWLALLLSSTLRHRLWTIAGWQLGAGNRDDVPEPSPAAARADRAAKNMLENLLLFAVVLLAAHAAGVRDDRLLLGTQVFCVGRVAYLPTYILGLRYLRTLWWAVGVVGMGIVASTLA